MFESANVLSFFPSLVWTHMIPADAHGEINAAIRTKLGRLRESAPEDGTSNLWQTDQDLHKLPEFMELNRYIMTASKGVLDFLEVEYDEFEITGCWANIGPPGGFHPAHNHPNNYLSGVYYVAVPEGSGIITFEDPRPQVNIISPRVKNDNNYNAGKVNLDVREGMLCVFPGWLIHSVPRNPTGETRISISFNVNFSAFTEHLSPPKWTGNLRSRP